MTKSPLESSRVFLFVKEKMGYNPNEYLTENFRHFDKNKAQRKESLQEATF